MHRTIIIVSLISAMAFPALADEPAPARQRELLYRLEQDCGSCHGMTLKGGLGPALLPGAIAEKADETLVDAILLGRPGTPMPPWDFEISPFEAEWLVGRLRNGDVSYDE